MYTKTYGKMMPVFDLAKGLNIDPPTAFTRAQKGDFIFWYELSCVRIIEAKDKDGQDLPALIDTDWENITIKIPTDLLASFAKSFKSSIHGNPTEVDLLECEDHDGNHITIKPLLEWPLDEGCNIHQFRRPRPVFEFYPGRAFARFEDKDKRKEVEEDVEEFESAHGIGKAANQPAATLSRQKATGKRCVIINEQKRKVLVARLLPIVKTHLGGEKVTHDELLDLVSNPPPGEAKKEIARCKTDNGGNISNRDINQLYRSLPDGLKHRVGERKTKVKQIKSTKA